MYESAKISKLKLCKTQLGNGMGANLSDKLENEEVLYLFRHCFIYITFNISLREFHKIIFFHYLIVVQCSTRGANPKIFFTFTNVIVLLSYFTHFIYNACLKKGLDDVGSAVCDTIYTI